MLLVTLVRKPAVCLMFMSRRRVRAKFDTFSDLQRQKLGSIMRSYDICLQSVEGGYDQSKNWKVGALRPLKN